MSFNHHGERDRESDLMKRFIDERNGTAKREFPDGRISGEDDGEITFVVSTVPGRQLVQMDFGVSTKWVAMSPQQAIEIAQSLIKQARSIATEPLEIRLY